jgi:photosystem II stability/assembly factor-like uncharacterized protein
VNSVEGTMTFTPVTNPGEARVALLPYGPEDALRLSSPNGARYDDATKLISGDVRIVSSHPLPMFDTKVVIESISNSSVTPRLDPTKGDGSLPQNGRPYYNYGTVGAGVTTPFRKWNFENPSGVNFTFTAFIWANVWLPSPGDGNTITAITFPTRNNGWAAGDQGKILATTDGGISWSAQNIRNGIDFKDTYFVSIDTGFACGDNETIMRTTNRGRSWQTIRTNSDPAVGRLNSIFFVDGQRGWAAGDFGTLLITTNGGTSWQKLQIDDSSIQAVRFVNATTGWAVGDAGTLLKSTDGGQTWAPQALPTDLQFPPSLTQLQGASFQDANNGIVVGSAGTLLRTTNGGANWTLVALPSGLPTAKPNLFGVAFANPTTGWIVGASGTVLKTTNGGGSWTRQITNTSLNLVAVGTPKNQTSFACIGGFAGALLTTVNGGNSWQKPGGGSGTSSQLNATDWIDMTRGWAVGMNGAILRTINGGQTWISSPWFGGEHLNDVYFVTDSTGFVVGSTGLILKTTNSGANWTQLPSGYTGGPDLPTATLRGVRFPDLNTGWACGSNGLLLKTTNGGSSWSKATFPATGITLEKMVWTDPQNGWIVYSGPGIDGGGIYRTANGGFTWQGQFFTAEDDLYAIRMFGPENNFLGFAVGEHGTILKTTNGSTWTRVAVPAAVRELTLQGIDFSDPLNGWAVGEEGTVLRTSNGGQTWTLINAGTNRSLQDVFFWEVDTGWVVGASGTIRKLN